MELNILGSVWSVEYRDVRDDPGLEKNDGYTDYTARLIVVADKNGNILNDEVRRKYTLRHEIIHAFLFESGLGFDWEHPNYGHDEMAIDWFAIQFPKLQKAFEEAGCL